ncbi:hypothetical protein MBLNU457_2193t1 [Dothideomycetes sp. NU457]
MWSTGFIASILVPAAIAWSPFSHGSHSSHGSQDLPKYPSGKWSPSHGRPSFPQYVTNETQWGQRNMSTRLPQHVTNGQSHWGTHDMATLPHYLNGPMPGGYNVPWGGRSCNNTNPYNIDEIPDTGVTRRYEWTVTNTTMAPDGVSVQVLVVNDQFPGPLIEANWGDWIEVAVTNNLPTEGTAIHWHGFLQKDTPWFDGTPGITQCPIVPGSTFVYRFRAELYGTTWWHAHQTGQYMSGLVGPMVIHGPKTQDYDIDVGPIMLSDWFHDYYEELIVRVFKATESGPILPPMADNMLIQGKSDYPCGNTTKACVPNAGLAQFKFQSGKKHLLRLINSAAEAVIFFSIDKHNLTVISNDFVAIEPYQTDLVTLGVGQRVEVIVEANEATDTAVWMRITEGPSGLGPRGQTGCSLNTGVSPSTEAAIFYEDADVSKMPTTVSTIDPSRFLFPNNCANAPLTLTVPQPAIPVKDPDVTLNFVMTGGQNGTGDFVWWLNNQTFFADWTNPTLLEAKVNNLDFPPERAVFNLGTNSSVRINMTSRGFPASHPMHMHGHNMQILDEGLGYWNGTIVNPENPHRRDTQLVRPNGYLVVQFDLDNPGMWMFHCHVVWHISEGMGITILEQTPTLQSMSFPGTIAQGCRDWSSWSGRDLEPQIDSGL